jgi:hypothetical protein
MVGTGSLVDPAMPVFLRGRAWDAPSRDRHEESHLPA